MSLVSPSPAESIDTADLLRVASAAARQAGALQRQHLKKQSLQVLENKPHDLKLGVDRLSERAIIDVIHHHYPDHGILSEEIGWLKPDSEYVWIVDPLDGTVNYYYGLPLFCVCVACYRIAGEENPETSAQERLLTHGQPLVGVVYAPVLDRLFSAVTGQGATCNGREIVPPRHGPLSDALVSISYGSDEATIRHMEQVAGRLVREVKKVRILGATGLDLVHVAMGQISALVQHNVRIWDLAAALIILGESGCPADYGCDGNSHWRILASQPAVFQELKDIVAAGGSP